MITLILGNIDFAIKPITLLFAKIAEVARRLFYNSLIAGKLHWNANMKSGSLFKRINKSKFRNPISWWLQCILWGVFPLSHTTSVWRPLLGHFSHFISTEILTYLCVSKNPDFITICLRWCMYACISVYKREHGSSGMLKFGMYTINHRRIAYNI